MTSISSPTRQALGIGLEEFDYPYPVEFLPVANDLQPLTMAYMDVPPSSEANGATVVLMHGKAFGGYYFLNVIEALTTAGYRVVAPDQIGWGQIIEAGHSLQLPPVRRQHGNPCWTTSAWGRSRCWVTLRAG
jgi:pimeloyl-ACP methyl ester carboxylesterase